MTPTPVRPWRLAVAGCGAAAFGLHLPLLTASDTFDVIAVADRDPARARTAQQHFAIPRTATRIGDLMADADVLLILTGVHDSLIEEALDAGVHVVTEKPVCLDAVRTRKLAARAKDAGLLLEVGAMRAHDPALHAALAHVPEPTGGWLVKADGVDEATRRRLLPPGFAPYTFDQDPPQPVPEHLDAHQVTTLQILLWQGYHLLTALVLAVPGVTAAASRIDPAGRSLHALLEGPAGEPFTLAINATPGGVFREQIHLTDTRAAATLDFARPYEPAATTQLTTADNTTNGFGDPFTAMWNAINGRLSGQHPADLPTSANLAQRVEDLALALAGLARPGTRTRKDT
ncbi:Gfo/Idh/MocA family oxidoreductase [Streptomyces sp. NPDC052287]|uniref:Gfo/Idh/MocA family protein n=1 Tax=Streptomyces sp. NPDC052287 TaxID=3154950 RepID=UPI003412927B